MILLLLLLSFLLSVFKPYYFVIVYGLIGNDMGSRGITGFIETLYPNYTLIMRVLLVISTIVATSRFYGLKNTIKARKWIQLSWCYITMMIVMLTLCSSSLTISSYLSRVTLAIATFGPGVFIIWMAYADKFDHKKWFLIYSVCQCLIAFAVIYGSYAGISWFQLFNAGLYNSEYFYLDENNDMIALPSNFYLTFLGKNSYFIRCGQFHNANGLGFASGVLVFLLLYYFFNTKLKINKLICLFCVPLAFLLWCNTGTRGPIVGIIVAFLAYNFIGKKKSQLMPLVILAIAAIVVVLFCESSFFSYFFGGGADASYASRKELNDNTFKHIGEFFLIGSGGDLDSMFNRGIDPHELPLRILCLYGIIPAIFVFILTVVCPAISILRHRNNITIYSISLFCMVLLVSLTNNFSEGVLFWLAFGESMLELEVSSNLFNE